jgi:hypothetical protein
MNVPIVLAVLSIWSANAFADGLSPMQLKEVLPRAEVIVLAEISSNDVTIVERNPEKGRSSVVYTCRIKANVLEEVKGHAPKAMDINFTFIVVKGVWLAWSGSGLEQQMKSNEKYVLLLTSQGNILQLLRAEKATELAGIKKLLEQPEKKESANKPSEAAR